MIYELCSQAAALITDRHLAFERGQQTSLGEERAKRAFIEDKVKSPRLVSPVARIKTDPRTNRNELRHRKQLKPLLNLYDRGRRKRKQLAFPFSSLKISLARRRLDWNGRRGN